MARRPATHQIQRAPVVVPVASCMKSMSVTSAGVVNEVGHVLPIMHVFAAVFLRDEIVCKLLQLSRRRANNWDAK